jgi:Fur family peroxide stress response transcriptional regulator
MEENIELLLRKNGLKATKPRIEIYKYLKSTRTHPTVREIFNAVKPTIKHVSFATVYNVVNDFKESGLIKEVSTQEDSKRYDGNAEPHAHLICKRCGKIEDLPIDTTFIEKATKKTGFKVEEISLNIYGICKDCLKKARK